MSALEQNGENLPEGIYYLDTERKITRWNTACEEITGFSQDDVLGKCCSENILKHVDARGNCLCGMNTCPVARCMKYATAQETEVYFHHKNGYRVFVAIRATPIQDERGVVTGAIEVFRENYDVTALAKHIGELETLALLDDLIEIGNQKFGEDRLNAVLQQAQTQKIPFGILKIDVDGLQAIHDAHGRDVGDRVLKMIAQTLVHNVQPFDCVARWHDKEFLIILVNADAKKLEADAEKLRLLVAASDLEHHRQCISATISIGATSFRKNDTAQTLLARADTLLLKSKQQGDNRLSLD